ncbi:uncharacterized protein LOC129145608 [Talpa occidentalis]|uniref:uncharacterized protein LOC129145608 n=1 Tax=Talpa occidentalis TaxID=50954 RepID=UPI0023F7D548|nr:uncharacterized protein LOC129145608 [Talpa occidentalis]XP_054550214.1 uncharacterized protein LOC129145608 [Talpa occidentalis]XP_054550215.1 uncharacterized protein LOC129145608 [Talpa occidentalis]
MNFSSLIPNLSSFSFFPALNLSSLFRLNITTSLISVNNWIKPSIWHMILILYTYVNGLQAIPLQSVLLGVFLVMCIGTMCYILVSMRSSGYTSHTENVLQQIQALNLAMKQQNQAFESAFQSMQDQVQRQNQAFDLTIDSVRDENRNVFESAFKSMQDQIQAALHKWDMAEAKARVMMQGRDKRSPSHEDCRRAELEEEEEIHLLNTLNSSGQRPSPREDAPPAQTPKVSGQRPSPRDQAPPEAPPTQIPEASQPPLPSREVVIMVSPPHSRSGTHFGSNDRPVAGQFPLRQLPIGGVNEEGRPAAYFWSHRPFCTGDLLTWKNSVPSYRQAPKRTANLFASVFLSHRPNWADIQLMLQVLLGLDERRIEVRKAREEAARLRQQDSQSPEPEIAVPEVDPEWDPNNGGLAKLNLYKKCLLVGLEQGIPKHKNFNKILELTQGLMRIHQNSLRGLFRRIQTTRI